MMYWTVALSHRTTHCHTPSRCCALTLCASCREERSKQLLALFQDTFSGSKAFVTGAEWKEVDQRIQGWRAAFKNLVRKEPETFHPLP